MIDMVREWNAALRIEVGSAFAALSFSWKFASLVLVGRWERSLCSLLIGIGRLWPFERVWFVWRNKN